MNFLRLIRFNNLLIIILTLFIIRFKLFEKFDILKNSIFNLTDFILFSLSIVLIAASGYIINDVLDYKTDLINKPNKQIINKKISRKNALTFYYTFDIIALILGSYLSIKINKPELIFYFITAITLLYIYSKFLKRIAIIGNLTVSFLTIFPILILIWIENTRTILNEEFIIYWKVIVFFAFLLNFIREIIKDVKDYEGDLKTNMKTLPIITGKVISLTVSQMLSFFAIMFLIPIIIYFHLEIKNYYVSLSLTLLMVLLLYHLLSLTTETIKKAINLIKIGMLIGLLTVYFI
jgi:4-hydroxybenzoate polyprenyltransferase